MAGIGLSVNKKIELIKEEEVFKSIVQDVEEEGFKINIPVNNGIYLPLQINEEYELMYYIDNGGCLSFNARVLERVVENNIHLYKLSKAYNVRKIQRRSFVRVNAVEYTFYKTLDENEERKWNKGLIVDLSGGGIKIKINEESKIGDKVIISLLINEEKISVKGEMVRVVKTEDKQYMCGITFTDLTERERDKIISKVFQLMRKQRGVL